MRTRITWKKFRKNVDTTDALNHIANGQINSYAELLNVVEPDECRMEINKAINADLTFEEVKRRVSGFLKRTETVQG